MNSDIHLRLETRRQWYGKRHRAIAIVAPTDRQQTVTGTFTDPPVDLWGATSGYAQGDINVERLGNWLSSCIGQPILDVVRDLYPARDGDDMRVLVTAEEELRPDLMKTPWELMESLDTTHGLPLAEHVIVVRVLTSEPPRLPSPAGEKLRIAILWANPRNDIPGLREHLSQLQTFISDHNSAFSMVGLVEFTNPEEVRKKIADQGVDLVYHIGHAIQPPHQIVQLLIGPPGAPHSLDVEQFKGFLQQIGPPRLVLLNSCAAAVGYQMNPYLGAALRMVQQIDAVVAMQTMVPVKAAIEFAGEFFRALAEGHGLASCLKRGRKQIVRLERPVRGRRSFVPYIPVLFQQTAQDKLFTIDLTGRELRQVLAALRMQIEKIDPYLERTHDSELLKLLQVPVLARRVTIVSGPKESGKSTSIRRAISSLTTEEQYRAGNRWLYCDIRTAKLTAGSDATQIHQLLIAFANALPTTKSLHRQLSRSHDPEDAIPVLANWLYEEERDGRKTCICLDNLDVELADVLARRSANVLTAGSLFLGVEQHSLAPSTPVNVFSIAMMSSDEVRAELQKQGLAFDEVAVGNALGFSNGLPYFVAGYILNPNPSGKMKALAANLIARYQPGPSAEEMQILQFASLCSVAVPGQLLGKLYSPTAIDALVKTYPFLRETEAETYLIPDALREYWKESAAENQTELHRTAFVEFRALGEAHASSLERSTYQRTTTWYREAFEHGCAIAEALAGDPEVGQEVLDETKEIAEKLHDRYFVGNEIAACLSLWEQFREVEHSFDLYDDRSADVRYAQCLMQAGRYDEADDLLEQAAVGDEIDDIQLNALFLRSNLIKDRGKTSEYALRLELLRAALEIARQLQVQSGDDNWAKRQAAALEHSLGNALGYGKEADPGKALEHLARAQKIFEELSDFGSAFFRAISEQIEIKRYNSMLSPDERQESIETLSENVHHLVTRDMQFDAVMHLYELGRLGEDPVQGAEWFERAFQRAADNLEPINWHAAIRWCIARVEAQPELFVRVAPELEGYAARLAEWPKRAWSRRVRRNALKFLAENYARLARTQEALAAARSSWEIVLSIQQLGEGRKDAQKRLEIARLYGRLLAQEGFLNEAHSVALAVASELKLTPDSEAILNQKELQKIFSNRAEGDKS